MADQLSFEGHAERHEKAKPDPNEGKVWRDCWQCDGNGNMAGCFEDTCCGADCNPEDAEMCCSPYTCDICKGKGGFYVDPATTDETED